MTPQQLKIIQNALNEDIGRGDITSSVLPGSKTAKADAVFREQAVLCGLGIAEQIFRIVDNDLRFLPAAKDGERIEADRVIFYAEGSCRSILTAERTALNFLGHLSGIATLTRAFVDEVRGTAAKIYDTRKTTPGLREFERYAVRTGGGVNHRGGLDQGVLIKDNHLAAMPARSIASLYEELKRKASRKALLGIEVRTLAQYSEALECGFHYILLDHFSHADVRIAVSKRSKKHAQTLLEVSGDITLANVRSYAECGVERISVGCLTHSVKATNISLNLI